MKYDYKRITEIDEQIEDLELLIESVTSSYFLEITIKTEQMDLDYETYTGEESCEILSNLVIEDANKRIKELRLEKSRLLNKKWWQFWI